MEAGNNKREKMKFNKIIEMNGLIEISNNGNIILLKRERERERERERQIEIVMVI